MNFAKPYSQWLKALMLAIATTGLAACVTINIYFPAAAAEKAADKVIDEIWQTPAGQTPASEPNNVPAATPEVMQPVKQEPAP